jgi:predicted O-linked N-acetylglucosamine transferase (SPINDLY family)
MQQHEEALNHAQHLVRSAPYLAFGHYLAGYIARELGQWSKSRAYLLRAVELDPSDVYARVLCCMSSLPLCMNEEEAFTALDTYAAELNALRRNTPLDTAKHIDAAINGIGAMTPFFLPYLGSNVKKLQIQYGSWVCDIMAAKYPHLSPTGGQKPVGGKVRIGIISNYFYKHSHWKIIVKGWLEQLDRKLFSIHCVHTGDITDSITEHARSLSDTFLQCNNLENVIRAIGELKLDVLIHSGIGMDTNTVKLAGLRLAPVQCDTWGHPVTTGMHTIDYFISSELMEPVDGDAHYSEKLIRLPNLSVYCDPPEKTAADHTTLDIPGVRHDDVILLCCQNLFKYLPQYDYIFPSIALSAPQSRFVFIECVVAEVTQRFRARIEQAFMNRGMIADRHVSFVPPLDDTKYQALNRRADIYLDNIGWSGGNTTLESLPFNKPIVTLPGTFMRGRHTYAILKMMEVVDTIADSVDNYVAIAVRLAQDAQWRKDISDLISLNKHKIYRDRKCISELERFLMTVSGRSYSEVQSA